MNTMPDYQAIAAEAVRGKPSSLSGHLTTPSFDSIIESFKRQGQNDREMLIALLNAKKAEDERCLSPWRSPITLRLSCIIPRWNTQPNRVKLENQALGLPNYLRAPLLHPRRMGKALLTLTT